MCVCMCTCVCVSMLVGVLLVYISVWDFLKNIFIPREYKVMVIT